MFFIVNCPCNQHSILNSFYPRELLIIIIFIFHTDNTTVLELSIFNGNSFVSFFQNGESPLHAAAFSGSLPVCKQLIAAGAEPFLKNQDGFTPKDVAQRNKHNTVQDYLKTVEERINNNNNNKS